MRKRQKLSLKFKGFDETKGIYNAKHGHFINSFVDIPVTTSQKRTAASQTKYVTPMLSASNKSWKITKRPVLLERVTSKV